MTKDKDKVYNIQYIVKANKDKELNVLLFNATNNNKRRDRDIPKRSKTKGEPSKKCKPLPQD